MSEPSVLQNPLERSSKRLELGPHGLHEEHTIILCESHQGSELGGVRGHWFLTQDVFLGEDRVLRVLVVLCMGGP